MLFARAELHRSKLRFGLLTIGAGLLVFVLLFQQLLLNAVLDGMAGGIAHQSAPVLVLTREASGAVGGSFLLDEQVEAVANAPGVTDASPLALAAMSIESGEDNRYDATIVGYQPGRPGEPTGLTSGRVATAPNEVVASGEDGPGRYALGDTITAQPGEVPLKVVGLTKGGRISISPTLWAPWPTYEELAKLASPNLKIVLPNMAAVEPEGSADPEQFARDLDETFAGSNDELVSNLEALTRQEVVDATPGKDAIRIAFMAVIGLGYLVVVVVIGFFFLTLTLQKQSSITLLRAIGAPEGYLVRSLLSQVAIVTIGGLVMGVLMVFLVVPAIRSDIPVLIEPLPIVMSAGMAMAVALLGAVFPMRRVLQTDPSGVFARPSLGGVR